MGFIFRAALDDVDVGNAAQRQRQRAGLARAGEDFGLFGLELERHGLADHGVRAVFFLRRLVDRQYADVAQDDFRVDRVGGAGGFILPNDRVDVILSKHEKNPDRAGTGDIINSEIILSNIRVLAIDQAPKEKDGQNSVVGKTVTLELKPEQTETLARARQSGTLSLALRSIADVNIVESRNDDQTRKRGDSINVIRYGVSTPTTTQK